MKNKFTDLNDHLFAQLERLSDEEMSAEQVAVEIQRGQAIAGVARQIVGNANLVFKAKKLQLEHGGQGGKALPEFFEEKPRLGVIDGDKKSG